MSATTEKCVFCQTPIPNLLEQNNPAPLSDRGRCCHVCNMMLVVPARIDQMIMNEVLRANRKEH